MGRRKYDYQPGDIVVSDYSERRIRVEGVSPDGYLTGVDMGASQ